MPFSQAAQAPMHTQHNKHTGPQTASQAVHSVVTMKAELHANFRSSHGETPPCCALASCGCDSHADATTACTITRGHSKNNKHKLCERRLSTREANRRHRSNEYCCRCALRAIAPPCIFGTIGTRKGDIRCLDFWTVPSFRCTKPNHPSGAPSLS